MNASFLSSHDFYRFEMILEIRNCSSYSTSNETTLNWIRLCEFCDGQVGESEDGNEGIRDSRGGQFSIVSLLSLKISSQRQILTLSEWLIGWVGKWWERIGEVEGGISAEFDQIDPLPSFTQLPSPRSCVQHILSVLPSSPLPSHNLSSTLWHFEIPILHQNPILHLIKSSLNPRPLPLSTSNNL